MPAEQHAEIKQALAASRLELLEMVAGFSEVDWETAVYSESAVWTIADLLRHLAEAERSMLALMQRIRQGEDGAPPDFDLDRWNASRIAKQKDKTPAEIISAMEANRINLLEFIDSLSPEDWQKKGRHGSLKIMTIEEICAIIAAHEMSHAAEMRRALA